MTPDICIAPSGSIRQAIACINRNQKGIVLVTGEGGHLLGTITDGDVRRAILAGEGLDAPVSKILALKRNSPYPQPVTALAGTDRTTLLRLMEERAVRQVPLVDPSGCVAGLATLDEFLPKEVMPLRAIIMAGGVGARLRPLTDHMPKPMLPVGNRPLLELTLEQLRLAGIRRAVVTTHYMPEKIIEHFGDGRGFGVELTYIREERPLGTAGALGLMATPQELVLVINGDILTQVNLRAMLAYHQEHRADMTVGVRRYDFQVPYGVLECEGSNVHRVSEKPQLRFFINAGIYLLEPSVHQYIPAGQPFDMPDLIQCLLDMGRPVVSFPIGEYWMDIGQLPDYERAQEDVKERRAAT